MPEAENTKESLWDQRDNQVSSWNALDDLLTEDVKVSKNESMKKRVEKEFWKKYEHIFRLYRILVKTTDSSRSYL